MSRFFIWRRRGYIAFGSSVYFIHYAELFRSNLPFLQVEENSPGIKPDEHSPGGEGEIRTPGTEDRTPLFESGTFNHSDTSPFATLWIGVFVSTAF